jgi:hypothetical protein
LSRRFDGLFIGQQMKIGLNAMIVSFGLEASARIIIGKKQMGSSLHIPTANISRLSRLSSFGIFGPREDARHALAGAVIGPNSCLRRIFRVLPQIVMCSAGNASCPDAGKAPH